MHANAIRYFARPSELGAWLEKHHAKKAELWVGYHKKGTGRPSLTWPESVDEAICYGWIDGIRKAVDGASFTVRFTPRKKGGVWSAINMRKAKALITSGRMRPAGLAAFRARRDDRSAIYSFEQRAPKLPAAFERIMRKSSAAWAFFRSRTDWYRRTSSWWVVSAKKDETRRKRLAILIACSREGRPIPLLPRAPEKRRSR